MGILKKTSNQDYGCSIQGTVGKFHTTAGKVVFLQTKARLSGTDLSESAKLTRLLTPAREALDVSAMNFNQLLQRDLDDHRIAHELVQYVLKPQVTGPAFFPPILAALLPFNDMKPVDELAELKTDAMAEDVNFIGSTWTYSEVPEVFRLQELEAESGMIDPTGTAILRWNDERAKLVIMDGQHRAMALLAVYRTLTKSWSSGATASERYRAFYEDKINSLFKKMDVENFAIECLEFPVTICLFLDHTGKGKNPHSAARKLFVDVNKEARPPSESRLILLSDERLDHVLSREILNRLKVDISDKFVPLYAVEYDNPQSRTNVPRRWSAVTNLEIILRCVESCCFGPKEYVENVGAVAKRRSGRPNEIEMNQYFRAQVKLQDILPKSIEDGPRSIDRSEVGLRTFPVYNSDARGKLLEKFITEWGAGLISLISRIEPYRAHIAAVKLLKANWGHTGDVASALAREALFDGVGMYWTLEQGNSYWCEQVAEARRLQLEAPEKSDVVNAWHLVSVIKKKEFEKLRSKKYLNKDDDTSVKESNELFSTLNTYAAQVGLALAWATLRYLNPSLSGHALVETMVTCINRTLIGKPVQSRDRRKIFRKDEKEPYNLLPKMESSHASCFRYFWLMLLVWEDNIKDLEAANINVDSLVNAVEDGERLYLDTTMAFFKKSLQEANRDWSESKLTYEAKEKAIDSIAKAKEHWFKIGNSVAKGKLQKMIEVEKLDEEYDNEDQEIETE